MTGRKHYGKAIQNLSIFYAQSMSPGPSYDINSTNSYLGPRFPKWSSDSIQLLPEILIVWMWDEASESYTFGNNPATLSQGKINLFGLGLRPFPDTKPLHWPLPIWLTLPVSMVCLHILISQVSDFITTLSNQHWIFLLHFSSLLFSFPIQSWS